MRTGGSAGNASVLSLILVALVAALIGLGVCAQTWVSAGHRANGTADLAALAVAAAAASGDNDATACAAGAAVAAANGGEQRGCEIVRAADEVAVGVTVAVGLGWTAPGLPDAVRATSYAGNPPTV